MTWHCCLQGFKTLCWLQVYAALNAVGEVGWSINQPMLEIIQSAYDMQEAEPICDLPRHRNVAMLAAKKVKRFRTARTGTQLLAQVRPACWADSKPHHAAVVDLVATLPYIAVEALCVPACNAI